jgi:hypothetical protein
MRCQVQIENHFIFKMCLCWRLFGFITDKKTKENPHNTRKTEEEEEEEENGKKVLYWKCNVFFILFQSTTIYRVKRNGQVYV